MDLTIEETEDQVERNDNDYWPTLYVDHLDGDKISCGEHHCCDSKAAQACQSEAQVETFRNLPVGIGEVGGVLECHDEDNNRDHHWKVRQSGGQNRSDRSLRTDPVNDRDKDLSCRVMKISRSSVSQYLARTLNLF
jgi:hypothetical protein